MAEKFKRTHHPHILQMWTVYERPRDFPDEFVVREWHVVRGRSEPGGALTAPTLEQARALVPPDAYRIPHQEGEDPKIVETWI